MDEIPFYVRVRFCGNHEIISMDPNDISLDSFKKEFIKRFNIKINDGKRLNLKLTDHKGAPIPLEDFVGIVKTFDKSDFSLFVEYTPNTLVRYPKIVTPMMIENYFWGKGAEMYLIKSRNLTVDQRKKIVAILVDFMVESFGFDVNIVQKSITAAAAVVLFPGLEFQDGESTELLLGERGWLTNRLKYVKIRHKEIVEAECSLQELSLDGNSDQPPDPDRDLEYLKTNILHKTSRAELIRKLNSTRNLRKELMLKKETDLRTQFPFFFAEPNLLLWDFKEEYKDLNHDAFLEDWPKHAKVLRIRCNDSLKTAKHSQWHDEIENVLLLLHVLPPVKPRGRGKKSPFAFQELTEKLITYRVAGTAPGDMIEATNKHPYIIAYGVSKDVICQYYVEIERHIFSMPKGFSFHQTFDFFFKAHIIFNLNFNPAIENAMIFVETYIYKMNDGKKMPTQEMKELIHFLNIDASDE